MLSGALEIRSRLRSWAGLWEDLSHQETAFSPRPVPCAPTTRVTRALRCPVGVRETQSPRASPAPVLRASFLCHIPDSTCIVLPEMC